MKLSPKKEAFCREIVKGLNPTEARRKVWNNSRCTGKSHNQAACRLMKDVDILARIKELSIPVVAKVRKTREELLDFLEAITFHDPGKMYDAHGNPLELPQLPYAERMAIAGFEFCEDFIGRRDGENAADKRVACGYTKKFRLVDRHKFAIIFGKMMGYIREDQEPDPEDKAKHSLRVRFVAPSGKEIKVEVNSAGERRLIQVNDIPKGEPVPAEAPASIAKRLGVRFVKPA